MKNERALVEGKILPTLVVFAGPFLLSSILQALYGAVDLIVVGQFADSASVSATAIGGQVMQTITGIVLGISTGGTVVIGQHIGGRQNRRASLAVGNLIALFGLIAVLLTAVMLFFTAPIVEIMKTPAEAVSYTEDYITICSMGIPFIVGYNGVSGIFRGFGDSRTPLYFVTLACIINIGLDMLLVAGLHMGVAGAAVATVAAQAISFITAVLYMMRKGLPVEFHKRDIGFRDRQAIRILKVGSPIAVQDALVNISFLIITAIINTMGLVASAAVGIDEKIIVFLMLVPTSFASAVAVMTAQNVGAGQMSRAKKSLWAGAGLSFAFGVFVWVYCQFFPDVFPAMFSRDPQVICQAGLYLRNYTIDCMMVAFVFCMNSFFSGCGYSLFSLLHSLIATFGVRVPVSYVISRMTGATLFEMGFVPPLASSVSIVLCLLYLKFGSGFREEKKIASPEQPIL